MQEPNYHFTRFIDYLVVASVLATECPVSLRLANDDGHVQNDERVVAACIFRQSVSPRVQSGSEACADIWCSGQSAERARTRQEAW